MRRTNIVRIGIGLTFTLIAAACSDAGTGPRGNTPSLSTQGNGVDAMVVGAGVVTLPVGFGDMTYVYNAIRHGDGRVDGHFTQYRERNGFIVDFSGEVTCLSVDPVNNRAWVGGVVTENRSTDPAFTTAIHAVGQDIWFRVVDNGNGADALPDRSTVFGFKGAIVTSLEYCQRQLWNPGDAGTFPTTQGQINVHIR
jgi:hypothetical protein